MHEKLTIENFTVFRKLDVEFSPGINVFIGENGTGKTHLLKLLYALQAAFAAGDATSESVAGKIIRVFRPANSQLSRLVARRPGNQNTTVRGKWLKQIVKVHFDTRSSSSASISGKWNDVTQPVFIPVKEMMSIGPGFRSMYDKYELNFEEVYFDILTFAYLPLLKRQQSRERQNIADAIGDKIDGSVVEVGEQFYLKRRTLGFEAIQSKNLEITLVAEGIRKLALLWKLLQNGSLPEGSTLFWDEPEANLNPTMMPFVAEVLLKLERLGVQIFAATHSYAFLKELDLQRTNETRLTFYSLFFEGEDRLSVGCKAAGTYDALEPNAIESEYLRLYEKQVDRALGSS